MEQLLYSAREQQIIVFKAMRLDPKDMLPKLKAKGYEIQISTLYKDLIAIDKKTQRRKLHFLTDGLEPQTFAAIDNLDTLIKLSYENYERAVEDDQHRTAQMILNSVARLQEILSTYYGEIEGASEFDSANKKALQERGEISEGPNINGFFASTRIKSSNESSENS